MDTTLEGVLFILSHSMSLCTNTAVFAMKYEEPGEGALVDPEQRNCGALVPERYTPEKPQHSHIIINTAYIKKRSNM